MSNFRRHINLSKIRLPNEYQEVKWLELKQSAGISIYYMNIMKKSIWPKKIIFSANNNERFCVFGSSSRLSWKAGDYSFTSNNGISTIFFEKYYNDSVILQDLQKHTIEMDLTQSFPNAILDGVQIEFTKSISSYLSDITYSFGYRDSIRIGNVTIYYAYPFIPCYRKSDNICGMYCIKNKTFYPGVGDIIAGDKI